METNTVYTANGWISQGCGIYSKDDKEPFYTRVARVSSEVPESEMIGVIELLRAAPETTRKLAEAEARIEKLEDAIMDALDENGYSLSPEKVSPRWVETARDAIGWRGVGITKGLQDALRAEYMRPCDERP